MRITIVGAGAIGRLWAAALAKEHQVHLWTRDDKPQTQFSFTPLAATHSSVQTLTFASNQAQQLAKSDCVLVTVKAFQVEQALRDILPSLSTTTPVIIMHNGMGSQTIAKHLLPNNPLLYATTAQAAFQPTPDSISHTGQGQTWLGALTDNAKPYQSLADVFNATLSPCQWHDDILQPLWHKLAINCAINPLTAREQCKNGELAQAKYQPYLNQICDEVAAVMRAEGYPTQAESLKSLVDQVIEATANNFSSMNQDLCHHRPTEIDYITGHVVARAQAHGIETPCNTQLWQQIKQLEQEA